MTRIYPYIGALAFGTALICSGEAAAQAMPGVPAMAGGAADRFSATVRGQVIYASNVAGGDAAVAALRGVKPEDVTYDVGTTINLQLPSSRQTLFLSATADLQRHERNAVLNADNYSVAAGGAGHLGSCTGTAIASYSRNQTQVADLSIAVPKNTAEQETASASVSCSRGALFAGLQGGFTKLTNSAQSAGFIGSETGNGAASVGYRNNVLGTVALSAQYSKSNYTNDPALVLGQPDGFEQYGVSLSYTRKIGLRLSGTASVSDQTLKAPATTVASALSSNNLGADVALNYRVSSRLGLVLGYVLSNQASPTVNATYVRIENVHLAGTYAVNPRVSVRLAGSKSRTEYLGGRPIFLQIRNSDDREIDGGASMKIGRKVALTLDASHTDRKADLTQFNFSSNQVTLGITGTF
jgi:hypothetical protein